MLTGACIGWLLAVNGVEIWLSILAGFFIALRALVEAFGNNAKN